MTRKQALRRFGELQKGAHELTRKEFIRLLDSGAVNLADAENNYRLPKNLLMVALENTAAQYRPFHPADEKEIKNLRRF